MKTNNKHQTSWLNLHLWIDIKDVRKLIYKKLNKDDINMVEIAHNNSKTFVLDKSFCKHCVRYGYVNLYHWGEYFVLKFDNKYKYNNYIQVYSYVIYNTSYHNPYHYYYYANMAAKYGHLSVLQWLFMHKKLCIATGSICNKAAKGGQLHVLQWLRQMDYPWNELVCINAALKGHLEVLQWARVNGCPWNEGTCLAAIEGDHFSILQWAYDNGCLLSESCYKSAIKRGNLDMVKWLYEHNCPRYTKICEHAMGEKQYHIVEWIHENNLACSCN